MTQKISSVNIEASTLSSFTGPLISTVSIANSSYVIVDDTAVSNAGGYAVIAGNNFVSGAQVLFGSTSATSVTYVNSSTLRVEVPALTAGSYVMYVQNPDGSTAIRLNGITSSPTPVWGTDSALTQQDAGVAFSISLSSTSDSNVTFALSSGSTLPPGTTLTSNGVFSGTITVTEETTYNFSVDAIDEENQDTLRSFSVTVISGDPNYKDTVLHLSGETTNNAWITDASTNGFALTVNGDTRPVAFSPYETVWSNFFDGTGDWLTFPNSSSFAFGTDSFTIEFWINAPLNNDKFLLGGRTAIGTMHITTGGSGSTAGVLRYVGSSTIVSTNVITDNSWHHCAIVRNGSSDITLYVDGVSRGTGTDTTNYTTTSGDWKIGSNDSFAGSNILTGYLSNLRIIKGTALYTSAFTPSTIPFTAITNTSLLTCQSNRLIDNSTNNFAITRNGDVRVSNFGPFVETDLVTGSGYFDGTGDYIQGSDNAAFDFGTEDFTIECWFMRTVTPTILHGIVGANGSNFNGWSLYYTSGNEIMMFGDAGSARTTSGASIQNNVWYHIAVAKVSSVLKIYVNGILRYTAADTTAYNCTANGWRIGDDANHANGWMNGYISNLRMVKGTAVYSGGSTAGDNAFTPPTAPLTAITNTSLLTLQSRIGENNNRFVDSSGFNNIITRSGNATQGTFSPHSLSGWSGYFTGSSTSFITTPSTTLLNQGQTYTVQCWIYPTSFTTSTSAVRRMYLFVKGVIYAGLSIHSDGTLGWYGWPTPGGIIVASSAGAITTNVWQHVALVVNPGSNYIKLFKNGVEVATAAYTAAGSDGAAIIIGHGDTGQGPDAFIGYISNFKITTSALTGAQLDYSATPILSSPAGSSLLTLQTNRFNDTSTNNLTITPAAAVSIQPFSPFKPSDSWSPTTVGGSMYFDGSGDYLDVSNVDTAFGSSADFTIDFWIYPTVINSATKAIFDPRTSDASAHPLVWISATNYLYYFTTNAARITGTTALTANQWYHVALVRNSGTTTLYLNGSVEGPPWADTTDYVTATTFRIAQRYTSTAFNYAGYIHNLRVVKGTAIYTSAFTPPTAPTTDVSGTTLLLNGINGGIIDYTGKNNLETVGDAKIRNNIVKYGDNSLFFDGTGDYLLAPSSPNLDFGTGDFTIEMWVNFTNATSTWQAIISRAYGVAGGWRLYKNNNNNQLNWYHNTTSIILTTGSDIASGVWSHIAVVRNGTTLTIYINGTNRGSATNTTSYNPGNYKVEIGSGVVTSAFPMTGYIDDLRITKGVARYTDNFTPPTSTFKTE